MSYTDRYTEIDGKWHVIALDEHTECDLPIPHANGWTEEPPEKAKVHCGPLAETKEKKK